MRIAIIAASMLAASQASAKAPETEWAWKCDFDERQQCAPTAGCRALAGRTWILLYPSDDMYWRCGTSDKLGDCDRYKAAGAASGEYRTFDLPGRAAFVKIGPDLSATEVVTLMDMVIVSYGKCEEAPPPIYIR